MTRTAARSALALLLIAGAVSGCLNTRNQLRTHDFRVVTDPPGARILLEDETGERVLGASPVGAQARYQVEVYDFAESAWLGTVLLGALTAASWSWFADSLGDEDATPTIFSGTLGGLSSSAFLSSLMINVMFQALDGQETGSRSIHWQGDITMLSSGTYSTMQVTATKEGFRPSSHRVSLPSEHEQINLVLQPRKASADDGLPDSASGLPER